ncbi:MAG TPA: DUF4350 domain-containing protein, partial [Gemmatimonadaceae bacterium]|nr:DUF4350 domain-containing protein [Gemmatimonadaceae bacterium]
MTATTSPSAPRDEWWTRPRIVLPAVAVLVVLVAVLTPQTTGGRTGDARLSSHLTGAQGARLFYATAERLGWRVTQRDDRPIPAVADRGTTIHAVLAPPIDVTPAEAHAYLEAVRGGDALLLVLKQRSAIGRRDPDVLADSLGVSHAAPTTVGELRIPVADTAGCPPSSRFVPPIWEDGRTHLLPLRWTRGEPRGRELFASTRSELGGPDGAVAVGFPLGRGRVAVLSDPDLLRNDVLRRCTWGADVRAVRILEWLRESGSAPRTELVFDEFHQGYGPERSIVGTTRRFLVQHPVGRTLLQLTLAALVLLLALAPRALPPADVVRVERRDPLEQIDAL